jgi:two-component sensor histidine kinase
MGTDRLTHRLPWHGHLVSSLVLDGIRAGKDQWQSLWPCGPTPGTPGALALAVVCVALATAVHISFGLVRSEAVVFAPYYAATLFAALLGGGTAGFLAMTMGGIVAYSLFAPAEWNAAPFTVENLQNWALYGFSSAAILWAAVSHRGLVQRLREEQQKRQLLNDELAHRLGNSFAGVQAVVNQSLASDNELRGTINARIAALAATNALLCKSDWQVASLKEILAGEFCPYDPSRVSLCGEDVQCPSRTAIMLALVVHELTTNAVKHGALSTSNGRIGVSWQAIGGRLTIDWVERGGPVLAPPTWRGFGSKLLQSAIRGFDGDVETSFEPKGLRCRISLLMPDSAVQSPACN